MIRTMSPVPWTVEVFPVERCEKCGGDRPHRAIENEDRMGRVIIYRAVVLVCAVCYPKP